MEYSCDLGFAIIHQNKPISSKLKKVFATSYKLNSKFFSNKPKKFSIFVCNSEEEFIKYAKPYYSKWAAAVALGGKGIAARSPELTGYATQWKKADFQRLMDHELSHVFWHHLCKSWSPSWLAEGLACHIGRNFSLAGGDINKLIKKHEINNKILDFRYLRRNFKSGHFPRYPIWQAFTGFIIGEFSTGNIRKLLKDFSKKPDKNNYQKSFKKIFGKSDRSLFAEFLESF